jgi:hypothetical protein
MIDEDKLTSIPNDKYQKLFDRFKEIDTLPISEWKYQHVLGAFIRKYQDYYHCDYQWKFNHPNPPKSFEVWQIKTLSAKLSSNPQILRDYIDWVFLNVVPKAKRKLTSISFMTKDEVVNNYKLNVLLVGQTNSTVPRHTPIPPLYREAWWQATQIDIKTYGDLAFISQMEPLPEDIKNGLGKMVEAGFDRSVLGRVV